MTKHVDKLNFAKELIKEAATIFTKAALPLL